MTWEDFPIFYRFGWGGIDSPEFRAALVAAYRHVGMHDLARRTRIPARICDGNVGGLRRSDHAVLGRTSVSAR